MRPTPRSRMALFMVGAMALTRVAFAQPEAAPEPVDAARAAERYAISPGAEPSISDMLGRGQALPGGCAFASGRIERTYVLATYTCGAERIELRFLHPEAAPPGSVRTKAFAIVSAGTPSNDLVEAIADRVRAHEATFEWTDVGERDTPDRPWRLALAVVVAGLAVSLGLSAVRRRRPRGSQATDH